MSLVVDPILCRVHFYTSKMMQDPTAIENMNRARSRASFKNSHPLAYLIVGQRSSTINVSFFGGMGAESHTTTLFAPPNLGTEPDKICPWKKRENAVKNPIHFSGLGSSVHPEKSTDLR